MKKLILLLALTFSCGLLVNGFDGPSIMQADSLQSAPTDQVLPDLDRGNGISLVNILRGIFGLLVLIAIGYLFVHQGTKVP